MTSPVCGSSVTSVSPGTTIDSRESTPAIPDDSPALFRPVGVGGSRGMERLTGGEDFPLRLQGSWVGFQKEVGKVVLGRSPGKDADKKTALQKWIDALALLVERSLSFGVTAKLGLQRVHRPQKAVLERKAAYERGESLMQKELFCCMLEAMEAYEKETRALEPDVSERKVVEWLTHPLLVYLVGKIVGFHAPAPSVSTAFGENYLLLLGYQQFEDRSAWQTAYSAWTQGVHHGERAAARLEVEEKAPQVTWRDAQ